MTQRYAKTSLSSMIKSNVNHKPVLFFLLTEMICWSVVEYQTNACIMKLLVIIAIFFICFWVLNLLCFRHLSESHLLTAALHRSKFANKNQRLDFVKSLHMQLCSLQGHTTIPLTLPTVRGTRFWKLPEWAQWAQRKQVWAFSKKLAGRLASTITRLMTLPPQMIA